MNDAVSTPSSGRPPVTASARTVEYLSAAAKVRMADRWFEIASTDHFWIRRRFEVLQHLAGDLVEHAGQLAEIGCGHGLLQRQIEDAYGREVVGFDLNEYALSHNVSRKSRLLCYDIFQLEPSMRERFNIIFLFDVLEHIEDEDAFLKAVLFHLHPQGRLIVNVPAGQWVYSAYDRAAGHVRRYSIATLRNALERNGLKTLNITYWGLPLIPSLVLRKLLLMGKHDERKIITSGFDSRSPALNTALGALSRCEWLPQKFLGTSLMAVLGKSPS
jgi:SAM-dependent methyltransferase